MPKSGNHVKQPLERTPSVGSSGVLSEVVGEEEDPFTGLTETQFLTILANITSLPNGCLEPVMGESKNAEVQQVRKSGDVITSRGMRNLQIEVEEVAGGQTARMSEVLGEDNPRSL